MHDLPQTARLRLRELLPADAPGILALDSDPEVLRYVPHQPMSTLAEAAAVVDYIRGQYRRNGIGRWAVELRATGEFVGWCGLKLVDAEATNGRLGYYDLGYRLLRRHWGQGYASEAAAASLRYAFEVLQLPEVHATVMRDNGASRRVLEKLGLAHTADFTGPDGAPWQWYTLLRPAFLVLGAAASVGGR
ncbi:GNAT family N-acetyltransferase [Hymenobacter coalescens]